jgi:phosphatidylethanolamine/phosphatidyl-N-methylethanolamine N-methyltransferase
MTVHTPIRTDDVRRSYAKWASHYDFTFALFGRKYVKQVVRRLNHEIHGHKVLDVGTGTGLSLPYFAPYCSVTGIDLSADMLAQARKRVARRKLTNVAALLEMDAANMDFETGEFDSVLATFVMSVVPEPNDVLAEIARVTRPGGRIYLFNHFRANEDNQKILSLVERRIAPASRKIGFHSDFCRSQLVLEGTGLRITNERRSGPLDMFTLITLKKET